MFPSGGAERHRIQMAVQDEARSRSCARYPCDQIRSARGCLQDVDGYAAAFQESREKLRKTHFALSTRCSVNGDRLLQQPHSFIRIDSSESLILISQDSLPATPGNISIPTSAGH